MIHPHPSGVKVAFPLVGVPSERDILRVGGNAFPSWANLVHIVAVDLGQCFGEVVG